MLKPDTTKGLECYIDTDRAGSSQAHSSQDPKSSHSRMGYIIMYAGCHIIWGSKFNALIPLLSMTEAKYIALSLALQEVITIMNLFNRIEAMSISYPFEHSSHQIHGS